MNTKKKIISLIPVMIVGIPHTFTWILFIIGYFEPSVRHIIALCLCIINLVLYFFKFNYGLIFTGIVLILAAFNLISLFPYVVREPSLNIFDHTIVICDPICFLMMVLYFIINHGYLMDIYYDRKYGKLD